MRAATSCISPWIRPFDAINSGSPGRNGPPAISETRSTRLGHEQNSSSGIPGLQTKLPESLEAAAGDGAKVKRGGAVAADAVRAQREFPVEIHVDAFLALIGGKTGDDEALG